jgi:hypothetical protein
MGAGRVRGGISMIVFYPGRCPGLLYEALSGHQRNAYYHANVQQYCFELLTFNF